jgi:hypothetical protein
VSALVANDEILDRPSERGSERERLVDRGRAFEIEPAQVGGLAVLRCPVERDTSLQVVIGQQRAPLSRYDVEALAGAVCRRDELDVMLEWPPARCRAVLRTVRGQSDEHEIAEVSVAVREPPGDVTVAAGHEVRGAGQAHAAQIG